MTDQNDNRAPIGNSRRAGTRTGIGHLLGMGMGMGMGTHASEGPHPYRSPAHMVYGGSLIDNYEWRHTVFLVEFLTNTDWKRIDVPKPKADDSNETIAELAELKNKQHHEDRAARHDEIVAESDDYVGLFENLCYFDAHSHPVISDLVQIVDQIGWAVVQCFKAVHRRVRPSYLDPEIRPIIRVPTHFAYPSGHSTQAHLIENALFEVFSFRGDGFRRELNRVAARIAENREWAGVHFKSDTVAGYNLAKAICDLAKPNSNFEKLIRAAKEEAQRPLYF
jgi:hypothetical protein